MEILVKCVPGSLNSVVAQFSKTAVSDFKKVSHDNFKENIFLTMSKAYSEGHSEIGKWEMSFSSVNVFKMCKYATSQNTSIKNYYKKFYYQNIKLSMREVFSNTLNEICS